MRNQKHWENYYITVTITATVTFNWTNKTNYSIPPLLSSPFGDAVRKKSSTISQAAWCSTPEITHFLQVHPAHFTILLCQRQWHCWFPSKPLNPANWAGSGVQICFSQTPMPLVPPLLPPRVQSQLCISNITAWMRLPPAQALDSPWRDFQQAYCSSGSALSSTSPCLTPSITTHCSPAQAYQAPDRVCAQCRVPLLSLLREQVRKSATCYLIHAKPSAGGVARAC